MSLPLPSAPGRPHYSLLLPKNFIYLTLRGAMQEAKTGICVSFCSLTIFYILASGWQMLTKKPLGTNGKTIKIHTQDKSFKKTFRVKKNTEISFLMVIISLEDIFAPIRQTQRG